jgi:hypothetical protein
MVRAKLLKGEPSPKIRTCLHSSPSATCDLQPSNLQIEVRPYLLYNNNIRINVLYMLVSSTINRAHFGDPDEAEAIPHAVPRPLVLKSENIRIEVITKQTNSLYGTTIKTKFSHIIYTGRSGNFQASPAILGVQIREKSKMS